MTMRSIRLVLFGLVLLGLVLLGTACSDGAGESDAGAVEPDASAESDAAVLPDTTRWLSSIGRPDHAQIAALPDGGVLLVTVSRSDSAPDSEVMLRAFDPDGSERWSQPIEGGSINLPWGAPAVAVHPNGDIYLTLGAFTMPDNLTIGGSVLECDGPCGAIASFDSDGEQRWVRPIETMQNHWLAAVDDGVVLGMALGDTPPSLTAIAANGDLLWEQRWLLDFPDMRFGGYLAGDGGGGFYVAGGIGGCGVLEHRTASDGSTSAVQDACGGSVAVASLSDLLVLSDGTVIALAHGQVDVSVDVSFVIGFGPRDVQFTIEVPYPARPTGAAADTALIVAQGVGPIGAIDALGDAHWQWPGVAASGKLRMHPSGLCQGSAVPAQDGEVYVLSLACTPARALLGAPSIKAEWSGDIEQLASHDWLLARLKLDADTYTPRCGNGLLDRDEECDGEDFDIPDIDRDGLPRVVECSFWFQDVGHPGVPSCTDECSTDLSACGSTCGNDRIDEGESCDGGRFRHVQSCDEAGLGSGPLGCVDCTVDLSVCSMRASCGNGLLEDSEACDGFLFRESLHTCQDIGIDSPGLVLCSADCLELDLSACM